MFQAEDLQALALMWKQADTLLGHAKHREAGGTGAARGAEE